MRAELRRSIFLACVGLLAGFALVVTLYGAGTLFKRGLGSPAGSGAPEESAPPTGKPPARTDGAAEPNPPVRRDASPGEGAAPAGKPLAALGPGQPSAQASGTSPGSEAPTFDIIRIEPNGEAVIAGRAAPNTTVELLRDNEPIARALVDPSGQFAIVPPALPTGSSEITLRVLGADGQARISRDSVAVVVSPHRNAKPLIALTSPDKPTIVLSQPDPAPATPGTTLADAGRTETGKAATGKTELGKTESGKSDLGNTDSGKAVSDKADAGKGTSGRDLSDRAGGGRTGKADGRVATTVPDGRASRNPAAEAGSGRADADRTGPVKIVSVEAEEGGRLYVTSQAPPGATVRLYLNDALVAPGSAGADGRVAFTIGRGVRPGDYKVRVDQVDPVSGKVKTRSEVAFTVPAAVAKSAAAGAGRSPEGAAAVAQPGTPPVAPGPVARLGTPENPATLPPAAVPRTTPPNPGTGTPQAPTPAPASAAPAPARPARTSQEARSQETPSRESASRESPSQASRAQDSAARDAAASGSPSPQAPPRATAGTPPAQAEARGPKSPVPETAQTAPQTHAQTHAQMQAQTHAQMQAQTPALMDRSPTVFVPEIGTATIVRGDSLWQISRRIYGKGTRYTVIFDANQPQIRNPDLIYPGQIFVLPTDGTAAVPQADKRG
ncbi:hypothetical protein ASG51_09455 [Methylobacterium sp. Leaf465]|uniref:LysM peptidoglycan-binding domain-containing protein n=1 Tax=unclassified Methylobacterium TaxID=2615210 RepID=UPI0006F42C9B|nr:MULTISPECIES: LysM peptidoglycan-binding domain-containing protein [unclassified Methylobacterium]KQT73673.1 hypothetical protein ASG51_09455 [Methylobacterium sp. Leaf465]KQU34351.1 hypothetical protein ASG63_13015 [Methylobacterium sp. Leaf94]